MQTDEILTGPAEYGFPMIWTAMMHGVELEDYLAALPGPGIHTDISMADYLALPYMSASRLQKLDRSPLQYHHSLTEQAKVSAALERGTALHMAVLEPQEFEGHYIVLGPCQGKLKSGKRAGERCGVQGSFWRSGESYCGTHDPEKGQPPDPAVEVLGATEMEKVLGMRDAILGHRRAASLFEGAGLFEATVIFDDPETGVRCKTRPDRLVERAGMLTDVKTTRDATHHFFSGDAERRGYFRKLTLYRRALRTVGWPYEMASVLAIESEKPHDLIPYLADETDLDKTEAELSRLLGIYARCHDENRWPGYAEEFKPLFRPGWATDAEDEKKTMRPAA